MRKNKSFSSIELNKGVNLANSPQQFRQINKNSLLNITKPDKALKKDKSFSDSEESESSSCVEKKYYRCGCLNHAQECGLRYHDYLSQIRQKRLLRKNKSLANLIDEKIEKIELLTLEDEKENYSINANTPQKQSQLHKIIQINESAEYSKRKNPNSIRIVLNGRVYYKNLIGKDNVLKCFDLIKHIIQNGI